MSDGLPAGLDAACEVMRAEVIAGLRERQKRVPAKYLYDARGSRLFDAICRTPEYYVTRIERRLLEACAGEVSQMAGEGRVIIEPGSGSSEKVASLVATLRPSVYVPVEICGGALDEAVARFGRQFPWLKVVPRCADFERDSLEELPAGRRLIFFPGSTIGNFEPAEAKRFLTHLARVAGMGGGLLIGVDLVKEPGLLYAAYNDGAGLTAAFNLNLLARFNRELDADFDLEAFEHRAWFAAGPGRVEMHLVSRAAQRVRVGGKLIPLDEGESIHTENSYKYTVDGFRALAEEGGWSPVAAWVDPARLFSVHYLTVVRPTDAPALL